MSATDPRTEPGQAANGVSRCQIMGAGLDTVHDASAWIDRANHARLPCADASNVLRAELALPAFAIPKIGEV